jgi:PKD repeat protein
MRTLVLSALLFSALVGPLIAGTLYVDVNNATPLAPFGSWASASTNIQDAIDAAIPGDLVLVTNGNYQFGEYFVSGVVVPSRVAVNKSLTVASVNGPAVTIIHGRKGGRTSLRGVYLADGAILSGFTITNGTANIEQLQGTGLGGGVYCQSAAAVVTNCVINGNQALSGGAVYQGTLHNCVLRNNTAGTGGGAYQAFLASCTVVGNRANSFGGGTFQSQLRHCTVVNNSALSVGGGLFEGTARDCIVYFNSAPTDSNHFGSTLNFSCTVPLPGAGLGNIVSDPQLSGEFHLSVTSPCRGAGDPAAAIGLDCDGEGWANPPSMGCDEYWPGQITGPLQVSVSAEYTNVTPSYVVGFIGVVSGKASTIAWRFGDGTTDSNRLSLTHTWGGNGVYPVTLTAYNEDYPLGISVTQVVEVVVQTVFYVAQDSASPVPPYSDWATAASDIQSAIDLATIPGQRVLVSNGVYGTGGRLVGSSIFGNTTNRVVVPRPMRVSSVNGPDVTTIEGQRALAGGGIGPGAVRCVYLAAGAVLDGFTLSGGATDSIDIGGGVYCQAPSSVVTNCILHANYGYNGGGAYSGRACQIFPSCYRRTAVGPHCRRTRSLRRARRPPSESRGISAPSSARCRPAARYRVRLRTKVRHLTSALRRTRRRCLP